MTTKFTIKLLVAINKWAITTIAQFLFRFDYKNPFWKLFILLKNSTFLELLWDDAVFSIIFQLQYARSMKRWINKIVYWDNAWGWTRPILNKALTFLYIFISALVPLWYPATSFHQSILLLSFTPSWIEIKMYISIFNNSLCWQFKCWSLIYFHTAHLLLQFLCQTNFAKCFCES